MVNNENDIIIPEEVPGPEVDDDVRECIPVPDGTGNETTGDCETMDGSQDLRLSIHDIYFSGLEEKYLELEAKFAELHEKVNVDLDEQSEDISSIKGELSARSGLSEFKQLRRDFDVFSKRLRRVVKAEDSINAEVLDAAKVPPDVLEITYAKTLNDLYNAMLNIFGDRESTDIVENARDKVRNFSAGVDFFNFENGIFRVKGLSDATSSKLVSVKQIHETYVELFKLLLQHVPNYSSQDFRSFVETGSREYTVEKVVSHERSIDCIWSEINKATSELTDLTENVKFIAELQNTQLDDIKSNSTNIDEINDQIQDIAKAINLHTKALKKLNNTLASALSSDRTGEHGSLHAAETAMGMDISCFEGWLESKIDRSEVLQICNSFDAYKEEIKGSLVSIQEQQQTMVSIEMLNSIQAEVVQLREQVENLKNPDSKAHDVSIAGEITEDANLEIATGSYEELIIGELTSFGPVTLKQLENQINSRGCTIGSDELSSIAERMEQAQLLTSFKKGRYTYLTLKEMINV
ncbi:hypothetical protein [Methanolobus halotolerans]|uniref:Uncharacterized protein n=1 Tax=Methanolobus halotolerans TaxID=2052935 RepID=A0A4E0PT38_9EURY|nr:hypothetical protein [Methanolobus halotolerans]TGC07463.1 hypothetical protein CUN85_11245 [Methanolobus halotolerans]